MIQEEFVQFETAKLLKAAGFPQDEDYRYYDGITGLLYSFSSECESEVKYAASTQSQAMRWLREEKEIFINIGKWIDFDDDGSQIEGRWNVDFRDARFANPIRPIREIYIYSSLDDPNSYEAAAEAGIQAACKYLIEEGGEG